MFLAWFISGIVLIFEGFPHASSKERFEHLSTFSESQLTNLLAPSKDWKGKVDLEIVDGKPVYRLYTGRKAQQVYDATNLAVITKFSKEYARNLSESFLNSKVKEIKYITDVDQWIPWAYYKPLLPIYKCYMSDEKHIVLYVSEKTGSIVQQTNRANRWAARCGAIPHWIYFKNIRTQKGLWVNLVIVLSAIGILVSISGIIAGFIRLVKRKGFTPYKKFDYKWHHITGLFFGLFVFTFILSGFFSLAKVPDWMVFVEKKENKEIEWNQKLDLSIHPTNTPLKIWDSLTQKDGVRKISWKTIHNTPHYFVYYTNHQIPEVYVCKEGAIEPQTSYEISEIEEIARRNCSNTAFEVSVQEKYDNYYRSSAMYHLPEPAYKIEFQDSANTWLYINPSTGEEVKRYNKNTRLRRWLYQGLHKFNIQFLVKEADWFRKLLLVLLSLGGIAVCLTGVWISKKWLKRTINKTNKKLLR